MRVKSEILKESLQNTVRSKNWEIYKISDTRYLFICLISEITLRAAISLNKFSKQYLVSILCYTAYRDLSMHTRNIILKSYTKCI